MSFVGDGHQGGVADVTTVDPPCVTILLAVDVDLFEDGLVVDVDFVGVDADDGTVLLVQLGDLEGPSSLLVDIVVEFVPEGGGC